MTIYDIAKLADASPAAVSRVINGRPGVSQEKRARIQAVISENNFSIRKPRKSSDHASFRSPDGARGAVALLIDDPISEYQSIGSTMFQTELFNAGYSTITRCTDSEHDLNAILADLVQQNISAVVMMGYSFTDQKTVTEAITTYAPAIPVILIRQTSNFGLKNVYCVGVNDRKGIGDCVDALVNHGRSNLGLIMDEKLGEKAATRYYFELALRQYEDVNYYSYDDVKYSVTGGEEAVDRILQEHPKTDGILCVRDRIGIGIVYGLQKRGYRIPEDISIIGKDNSKLCEACNPPLTSLDSLLYDCFRVGIHLLLDILNHQVNTHGVLLTADIVQRGTL